MNKKEAIAIAKSLKINITDCVVKNIIEKHEEFMKKIDLLKKIDTTNIEPMHRVDETKTSFMREDIEGETLPIKTILENAPKTQGNFVTITKVVK